MNSRTRRAARPIAALAAAVTLAVAPSQAVAATGADGVARVASAGCRAQPTPPGEATLPFSAAGRAGSYIRDVPAAAPGTPLPVVFDLHGYLEPATTEHRSTGLSRFGDRHGFVTITPEIAESGLPRWDFNKGSADVAFLGDLLTGVESTLCVDERRVFVTGISMGAITSSSLACQLADRVAAVAPVAGLQNFSWCRPARPVPVVSFHGTADPFIAYTGGDGPIGRLLPAPDGSPVRHPGDGGPSSSSIPDQVAAWAARNGCAAQPTPRRVAADVTLLSYPCPAGDEVEFYSIAGGGHTWPGADFGVNPVPLLGATTMSIDANRIMWDFFRTHPLTGPMQP
jgi:polyhydroxybutyrate depolymerase